MQPPVSFVTVPTCCSKIDMEAIQMKGYGSKVEMKYTAWKLGARIQEVPIIFTERTQGASKMSGGIFPRSLLPAL